MQELVRGHPAQDQRRGLSCVNTRWDRGQVPRPKRAIGSIRPENGQICHSVAELKALHAISELIDFPDYIIAHYKRWPAGRGLRVEMTPDQRVGVFKA